MELEGSVIGEFACGIGEAEIIEGGEFWQRTVEVWQGGEVEGKLVIVSGEVVWEEGVGLVDGVDIGQAQLGDEAELVGLVGAFDAAPGLGGEGRDYEDGEAAAQLAEEAAWGIELAGKISVAKVAVNALGNAVALNPGHNQRPAARTVPA
jgi:hypothetical protein